MVTPVNLNFTEYPSRSEMLDAFRDKRLIILESDVDGVNKYYKVNLPTQYDDIRVVVFSTGHQPPTALWFVLQSELVLACDRSVYKVDLAIKEIKYSRKMSGIFSKFLQVEQDGGCTVLHELGIVRLQSDGTTKWAVDTGIVEDFKCNGTESIRLTIMDEHSLDVNLATGLVTEG